MTWQPQNHELSFDIIQAVCVMDLLIYCHRLTNLSYPVPKPDFGLSAEFFKIMRTNFDKIF